MRGLSANVALGARSTIAQGPADTLLCRGGRRPASGPSSYSSAEGGRSDAAAELSDATFCADTPRATRSLRATLAHQVECEWAWRVRLRTGSFPAGDILPGDFDSLNALLARWRHEQAELRALASLLDQQALAARPKGATGSLTVARCLLYVVNHGTQQFAEAAVLLSQLGHSPGEIGYLAFCGERSAGEG